MAFNQQEQDIIKFGLQNGKTKEEVTKALTNFRSGYVPPKPEQEKQSFLQEAGQDLKQVGTDISSSLAERGRKFDEGTNLYQKVGQGFGLASDVLGAGVKGIAKAVLPQAAEDVVKSGISTVASPIINSDIAKSVVDKYNSLDENTKRNLDATLGIGSLALDVATGLGGKKVAQIGAETAVKGATKAGQVLAPIAEQTIEIGGKVLPKSPEIMNRVARLTPKQANDFKRIAGKSQGDYLVETGNFGSPDKIITKEAEKFINSKKDVDAALETLQGNFQDGSVKDALSGLIERAKATSGENIKSPYLKTVEDLIAKHDNQGLTMSEINQAKRLYERNVKLGYNKLINGDKVEQATNIDNALREWQVSKAKELGFDNISEMNKQTQISKNLIDSLGKQLVGQEQTNALGLTDWIMLSGGDPTSVAGLLAKKLFSSKNVQSKIAEMLSGTEVKAPIKPLLNSSKPTTPQPLQKLQEKSYQSNVNVNNTTAPITNTSNRIIDNSIPQKKGVIQTLVDKWKDMPNKQGGFISLGSFEKSAKDFIKMKPEIGLLQDLDTFIDIGRIKKPAPYKNFEVDLIERLEKMGVELPKTRAKTADFFETILRKAEWSKVKDTTIPKALQSKANKK